MTDILELVQFKTKAGVSTPDFVKASVVIGDWVQKQPGFRYRSLSCDEQGLWRDVCYWDNMANAKAAGDAFMRDNGDGAFMGMIDAASVVMSHSEVQQSLMGTCDE